MHGCDFDESANHAEESGCGDGQTTTNNVGHLTSNERTNQSTSTETGGDGTLSESRESAGSIGRRDTETSTVVGHGEETRDLTRCITEHETSDRGNKTQEPGEERSLLRRLKGEFGIALLERGSVGSFLLSTLAPENHGDGGR